MFYFPPKEKYRKKSSVARETTTFHCAYLEKRHIQDFSLQEQGWCVTLVRINKEKSCFWDKSIILCLTEIIFLGVKSEIHPFLILPFHLAYTQHFLEVTQISGCGQTMRVQRDAVLGKVAKSHPSVAWLGSFWICLPSTLHLGTKSGKSSRPFSNTLRISAGSSFCCFNDHIFVRIPWFNSRFSKGISIFRCLKF